MTDSEITKLCAEEMEYEITAECEGHIWCKDVGLYAPLLKDEQAMALVKKLGLCIEANAIPPTEWSIQGWYGKEITWKATQANSLNRAICECVAKMQQSKQKETKDAASN